MTLPHRIRLLAKQARLRGTKFARRAWMKYALRGTRFTDNHEKIDRAYKVEDPWVMNSPKERFRFERTNELIAKNFPSLDKVLEIGCGEGHQTEYLARTCQSIYGFDVSATAVERARKRLPDATFAACDLATQPFLSPPDNFDLVVACEVLYYMEDIPATLATMEKLGRACMVTYYDGRGSDKIRAELGRMSNTETASFSFEDITWRAVWWTPTSA